MRIKRVLIVLAIVAIGGVAPARAWCEATCLAPAAAGEAHCPTHDPADAATAIAASSVDECPVLESARPTVPARFDVTASFITTHVPAEAAQTYLTPSFARPHSASTVFERSTPLRI